MNQTTNENETEPTVRSLFVPPSVSEGLPLVDHIAGGAIFPAESAEFRRSAQTERTDPEAISSHIASCTTVLGSDAGIDPDLQVGVEVLSPAGRLRDAERAPPVFGELLLPSHGVGPTSDSDRRIPEPLPEWDRIAAESNREPIADQTPLTIQGSDDEFEFDLRIRQVPFGAIRIGCRLRREPVSPYTENDWWKTDSDVETPPDLDGVAVTDVGATLTRRLVDRLEPIDVEDLTFAAGPTESAQGRPDRDDPDRLTIVDLLPATDDLLDLNVETDRMRTEFRTSGIAETSIRFRGPPTVESPEHLAGAAPREVALVEAELDVAESQRANYSVDVFLWIPIAGNAPEDRTFEALRYAVVERARGDYDTLTDRTAVEDSAHVYDPDEDRFAPRSPDATTGPEVRSDDGATLVCPITPPEWFGLTSVRTCSLGVLEVNCWARLLEQADESDDGAAHHNDGEGQHDDGEDPDHRSRPDAEWIDVRTPCRVIADTILDRTSGIPPERLYLAAHD